LAKKIHVLRFGVVILDHAPSSFRVANCRFWPCPSPCRIHQRRHR
jgi:hypothetical protein